MRIELLVGAYSAQSTIASNQRCINLVPEVNPPGSLTALTHYQRPGLRPLVQAVNHSMVRGLYTASNGDGYCVVGTQVYFIHPGDWSLELIGAMAGAGSERPVSMTDNGIVIWLADGSPNIYQITLNSNAFATLTDVSFLGADKVDYIDTFMVWNNPFTNQFGSTLSNTLVPLDPTYIAATTSAPDPIVSLAVNKREIVFLKLYHGEVWYDAGNPLFPFAELPGSSFDHGCIATFSVAQGGLSVYWLSQDKQGHGIVMRLNNYQAQRISNHALEWAFLQYGPNLADAIGYTYQIGGHFFYEITFPTQDVTWTFDETTSQWHQRGWTDAEGVLHRNRATNYANLYQTNVVGDWQNGTLYELDVNQYFDTVYTAGVATQYPLTCTRGFPHLGTAQVGGGTPGLYNQAIADGKRMQFQNFVLDMECGTGTARTNVTLRYSVDRGKTFGTPVPLTAGTNGQFLTEPKWSALGIARDMVFEISYDIDGPAALNGAWFEATVLNT